MVCCINWLIAICQHSFSVFLVTKSQTFIKECIEICLFLKPVRKTGSFHFIGLKEKGQLNNRCLCLKSLVFLKKKTSQQTLDISGNFLSQLTCSKLWQVFQTLRAFIRLFYMYFSHFFFKSRTSKTFLILSFDMNFFSEEIFIKIIIITCLQNSVPPVCFVCFEFKAFVQLLLLKDRRHGGDFVVGYSLFISLS